MRVADKNNIQNAIKDLLDLIDKSNEIILLHQTQSTPDEPVISGLSKTKVAIFEPTE